MIQAIQDSALPNLCKPKADNFIAVDNIPLLGSGKPDFMRIKAISLKTE
jgi:hypothetical protein